MERLSSNQTVFYKFVFPLLLLAGVGFITIPALMRAVTAQDPFVPWSVTITWALAVVIVLRCARFKTVWIQGNELVISSFLRLVRVPLSQAMAVHRRRFFFQYRFFPRRSVVIVDFFGGTPFGGSIVFLAKYEVADRLNDLRKMVHQSAEGSGSREVKRATLQ
jgi:hypothetical protein